MSALDFDPDEEERVYEREVLGLHRPAPWLPDANPMLIAPDVDELLAEGEPQYDWILPKLLERGDRLIVTGPEGGGKTTFLRQIAVSSASSVDSFTGQAIEPVRSLFCDCENPRRHSKREFRKLREIAGDRYVAGHLRVRLEPNGIDLTTAAARRELCDVVHANRPDVLFLGPIYKLAAGDPNDERQARTVAAALDEVRNEFGCAIVIEAHSPHASNGASRPIRPYGASLWLRWPEFGLYLGKDGKLDHWRGPRDERAWPARLRRGGEWPWTVAPDTESTAPDGSWRPTNLMERVSRELEARTAANDPPSRDALASAVTGKKQFLLVAIDALVADGYAERDGRKLRSIKPYRETP